MSSDDTVPIKERVKQLLGLDEDLSSVELAELLRECRIQNHPDKYQDPEIKEKGEEKFKRCQELLPELEKQIDRERLALPGKQLATHRPLYDLAKVQSDLDRARTRIEELENEAESERQKRSALQEETSRQAAEAVTVEVEELEKLYRPTPRGVLSIGVAAALAGCLGVMSQMEKVSQVLSRYAPFDTRYISAALFFALIILVLTMVRQLWEGAFIRRRAELVRSPIFVKEFAAYLKDGGKSSVSEFSEADASDFVAGPMQWRKVVAPFCGLHVFEPIATNRLKDIFLHNLLNKKLVKISHAEMLQRYFSIVERSPASDYWFNMYVEEKKKNESRSKIEE